MEKADRRVKYTRALLRDALVTLLRDRPISEISVTQLCETAGVHRSTFYAHFADPQDLLRQLQNEVLDNVRRNIEEQSHEEVFPVSEEKCESILEYARKNSALIMALLGENSGLPFQQEVLNFCFVFGLTVSSGTDERTNEYVAQFMVMGCIALLRRWLQDGARESPAAMARLIMQLVRHGYDAFRNAGGFSQ